MPTPRAFRVRIPGAICFVLVATAFIALAGERMRPPLAPFATSSQTPQFEEADCPCLVPPEARDEVRCGYLEVPENRSAVAGRTLRIAVALLRNRRELVSADTIVYLEGGPGGGTLSSLTDWIDSPLRDRYDLVLFDQRGSGFSEPDLSCPEMDEALDEQEAGSREMEHERLLEAARLCGARLRREGVDLSCYGTASIAADAEDLRKALGIDRWNLYGISYGTRVALTIMRDYPKSVRSAVLDSCVPPEAAEYEEGAANTARAFRKLFDACESDIDCRKAFPDLEGMFLRLKRKLDAHPLVIDTANYGFGEPTVLVVDGDDLAHTVFQLLYDRDVIPYIPLLLFRLRSGDAEPLARVLLEQDSSTSDGLYYCVECRDEAPFNRSADVAKNARRFAVLGGFDPLTRELEICEAFGIPAASAIETLPVRSPIPTLVLAGGFDPITPPSWGRRVARALPHSFFVEFPPYGHSVTSDPGCPTEVMLSFLEDPSRKPATWCLSEIPPLLFATGQHERGSPYGIAAPEGQASRCVQCGIAFIEDKAIQMLLRGTDNQ